MPAKMRSTDSQKCIHVKSSNRLILCFDGTGNAFQGTPGDTNIVKLYNMLDRTNEHQMHYYQPGIGTYPAEGPVNVSWFRTLARKFEAVIDSALATSFDSHVIAGYRFIMRYYKPGDRIYIFGFSRGAFTARFLSRMISHVGLLSMGNEELVPFAYQVYQEYEQNRGGKSKKPEDHETFMNSFKKHFCRSERERAQDAGAKITENESGIKVHFLGLFDCVSSVGNLDVPFFQKTPPLPAVRGTAEYVRHAVAIDERRVKFKAALFSQAQNDAQDDIKEVWFPGNHGDIGGGWDVPAKEDGTARKNTDKDYFQLSDIALKWMIDEIDDVETSSCNNPTDRFAWDTTEKTSFLERFQDAQRKDKNNEGIVKAQMHDTMKFGGGSRNPFKIMLWNFMEYLPWVIKRWEYVETSRNSKTYIWDYIGWPPNRGERRDIPSTALFHHSVISRMRLHSDSSYRQKPYVPDNALWVKSSGAQVTERPVEKRNLKELANHPGANHSASHHSERQRLVEPHIHFVHDRELTTGSVALGGSRPMAGGAKKWDRIYRVVKEAS